MTTHGTFPIDSVPAPSDYELAPAGRKGADMTIEVNLGQPRKYPEVKPPEDGDYLIWDRPPGIMQWKVKQFRADVGFPWDNFVTHWLPMPPPPERS